MNLNNNFVNQTTLTNKLINNSINLKFKNENDTAIDMKNEIQLRNLCPDDIEELKKLCAEWFPVE